MQLHFARITDKKQYFLNFELDHFVRSSYDLLSVIFSLKS